MLSVIAPRLVWGARDVNDRGPVVPHPAAPEHINVNGRRPYSIWQGLGWLKGVLARDHRPDHTGTEPVFEIRPGRRSGEICSFDPFGHMLWPWAEYLKAGVDVRRTIGLCGARLNLPEIQAALATGALQADGEVLREDGLVNVDEAAIDPVWHLPSVAKRIGKSYDDLRETLIQATDSAGLRDFPDREVYLPQTGSTYLYLFGDLTRLGNPNTPITARIHDQCVGSDVFRSDICTCWPFLAHAIEECVRMAQQGGIGVIAYFLKEGRCHGAVPKFEVYMGRQRQEGGDRKETYFACTSRVAGAPDLRFQPVTGPDVFYWLGIDRISRLISMSDDKYAALVGAGIAVEERVEIPEHLIPNGAGVEITAKKGAGYYTKQPVPNGEH